MELTKGVVVSTSKSKKVAKKVVVVSKPVFTPLVIDRPWYRYPVGLVRKV